MKTAIVTITSGDFYTKMGEITHPLMEAYAEKIGATFIILEGLGKHSIPHYRKLDIKELFDKYDRILYIDTDILVRPDTPNLFEVVPEDHIGAFNEGRFVERAINFKAYMKQVNFSEHKWNGKYYNTGVLVLSRQHANIFEPPPEEHDNFKEQSYLNVMLIHTGHKIKDLSYRYNRMYCMDPLTGEERFDSYLMHYAGINLLMSEEQQLDTMKKDLEHWEKNHPDYKFPKHLAIHVGGGMGDQIDAEPVIRYIRDYTYKGADIVVFTDWPELFSHLGLRVYKHRTPIESPNQFYQMNTLNTPEHDSWQYMTHPLIHGTDFSALQCIRMILPLKHKEIILPLDERAADAALAKGGGAFDVIVHPGRGWDSKTIPGDLWKSYVDTLVDAGFRVGVIGKRISKEQGIVEFDIHEDAVDLIDKLTVPELIGIVAKTPVLISNDSVPIHIAGAFENYIGVIATCKHPDKILPWRRGEQYWRAEALEEWPLYDAYNHQPSQVDGATIDHCTEEQMRRACPPASKILDFVHRSFDDMVNSKHEKTLKFTHNDSARPRPSGLV